MAAIALMVVMIARPQTGSSISHEKRQGIQTMICLDISNSMMAQDVAPSRLEKSKIVVEDLVDHFRNDQIGMVVFAGDAFIQLPIQTIRKSFSSRFLLKKYFVFGIIYCFFRIYDFFLSLC